MKYNINIDSYIGCPISAKWVEAQLAPFEGKPVTVRVNSYGGDLATALSIRQLFVDHGNVTVHYVGCSASAATVLAMGAKRIIMSKHALLLIHQCSQMVDTFKFMNRDEITKLIDELKNRVEDQEKYDNVMANIYAERSGSSIEAIAEAMKKGRWMTAEECKSLGIIDEITDEGEEEAMSESVLNQFQACGLPLPVRSSFSDCQQSVKVSLVDRIANFFANLFDDAFLNEQTKAAISADADGPDEEEEEVEEEAEVEAEQDDAGAQAEADSALEAANARIKELETELQALREADGDESNEVQAKLNAEVSDRAQMYGEALANYESIKHLI